MFFLTIQVYRVFQDKHKRNLEEDVDLMMGSYSKDVHMSTRTIEFVRATNFLNIAKSVRK